MFIKLNIHLYYTIQKIMRTKGKSTYNNIFNKKRNEL